MSTRPKYPVFEFTFGNKDYKRETLVCNSIYLLSNRSPDHGGSILHSAPTRIVIEPTIFPHLVARRAFNIVYNPHLNSAVEDVSVLENTVREGVWFPFLERRHLRDDSLRLDQKAQVPFDISGPTHGFGHLFAPLPGVEAPEMAERLAFWSSECGSKIFNSPRGRVNPELNPEEWDLWYDAAVALEKKKQDGRPLFRDWIAKPPGSSPARCQGYSSSALQPPEPSRP